MKNELVACCGVVAVAGVLLSGCSAKVETSVSKEASVSADSLQKDLTDRITKAGMTVKSVTCKDDLVGEVGKTARCDVAFSDTNNVEAVLTTTKVDGDTVSFDMTPAMTKEQVQKAVAGLASASSATCAAGLDGKVGATTTCEVTKDGTPSKVVAEVAQVDAAKLGLELSVYTMLPKQKVEEVLMQKLAADGTPVETVDCVDDIASKVGSTVECVTVTGNDQQGYDVTVSEAEGDTVNFDYKAKP
ncbi:MAG: DUF4333 domain-containing protein [Mycobacterium sp.]|nr:DUF4333 domain-containing protein [Mycobacterium sp.]